MRSSIQYFTPASARAAIVVAILLAVHPRLAHGQSFWDLPAGGSWNTAANWNPTTIPNGTDVSVVINNGASASNLPQTGNRSITLDGAQTIGSITFNNDVANGFTQAVATGTGGPLTFATSTGTASIDVPAGPGTGNNTISVATVLNSTVVAQVDNINTTSATGALNLTAAMSGPGGFTKQGDGMATFGTGAKTYTGPTVFNGGRTRISQAAQPSQTSSFTINAGGQIDLITAGTFTFGSGPLNLNGTGPTSGPFAAFPGAIRPDRPASGSLDYTITNNTVLQTDSLIHMEARSGTGSSTSPSDSITLSGVVSGPGKLTFTAPNSDVDQGFLILTNANTYAGGTLVAGGIVEASGANATFGTGNVTIDNTSAPNAIARLRILPGVSNAIADTATLSILGGGTPGVADINFVDLGAGINETVGGLILGGVAQAPGTYGSTTSGAANQNNDFFTGDGTITVVPEPGTMALAGLAGCGLVVRCIRRRRRIV